MASTKIERTPSSNGSARIFTWSAWIKRGKLGSLQAIWGSGTASNDAFDLYFGSTDLLSIDMYDAGGGVAYNVRSVQKFRDPSAWYHIVIAVDTTQSTSTDRYKIYVNGSQITLTTASNGYPAEDYDIPINQTNTPITIGIGKQYSSQYFEGCMTHVHFIDGTAYQASTFGETDSTSGIWVAKTSPSVTYGTNGFFLKFENSGNMDLDSSGNNLSFTTAGNLTQNVDTPANNFATLTPLHVLGNVDLPALANGNLTYTGHSGTSYSGTFSTIAASSGKWYAEFKCTGGAGATDMMIGAGMGTFNATGPGAGTGDMVVFGYDGKYYAGSSGVSYGTSWTSGDIISVAMDLDNNKMYIRKNDSAWMNSGNPASGSTGTGALTLAASTTGVYHFLLGDYGGDGTPTCESNFGQGYFGTTQVASANADANGHGIFEYAVPSGYYSLNTKNLKEFG